MSKYMQVLTKVCVIEHRLQRLPSEVQASRRRARRLNEMAPIELQAFSVNLRSLMQGCYRKTTQNEHRCSCEVLSLQCPGAMRYFFKILRPPLLRLCGSSQRPWQRPRSRRSFKHNGRVGGRSGFCIYGEEKRSSSSLSPPPPSAP